MLLVDQVETIFIDSAVRNQRLTLNSQMIVLESRWIQHINEILINNSILLIMMWRVFVLSHSNGASTDRPKNRFEKNTELKLCFFRMIRFVVQVDAF